MKNSVFVARFMKPSEALQTHHEEIRQVVAQNRTCNPRVFGSVLHGKDQDGSDLDYWWIRPPIPA